MQVGIDLLCLIAVMDCDLQHSIHLLEQVRCKRSVLVCGMPGVESGGMVRSIGCFSVLWGIHSLTASRGRRYCVMRASQLASATAPSCRTAAPVRCVSSSSSQRHVVGLKLCGPAATLSCCLMGPASPSTQGPARTRYHHRSDIITAAATSGGLTSDDVAEIKGVSVETVSMPAGGIARF